MAISFLLIAFAKAQQTTFRDANGRISTTVTTDSNGMQTFRNGAGRTTGTATRDSNGTTTFRDGAAAPPAQLQRRDADAGRALTQMCGAIQWALGDCRLDPAGVFSVTLRRGLISEARLATAVATLSFIAVGFVALLFLSL